MPGWRQLLDEEPGATLPIATSSNLLPDSGQSDLPREVARGTSMGGNTGETVTVPKTDWARALKIAGLALRDIGSSLRGQPTNFLMEQMLAEEGLNLRQQESARAERQVGLQERGVALQERHGVTQERAQFLNELLTITPRLFTVSDEKTRLKAIGALEQRASQFGLQPLVRGLTGDAKVAKLAGEYAPLLQKYGTEGLGIAANQLFAKGDAAGAIKLIEGQLKPAAMQEARDSVRNIITNLTEGDKRPSYADVLTAVRANSPLSARVIEQNPDFYSGEFALRGIRTPKVAEIGAEAAAKEKSPVQLQAEAKAKKAGELAAEQEGGGPSAIFKSLDNNLQAFLAGRGQTNPTSQQVEEARLAVKAEGDTQAMSRSLRTRAVAELNRREGTKAGKKPGTADALFSNLPDADVKLLSIGDENVMAALLKSVLGSSGGATGPGVALKNGKTKDQNIAELMKRGRSRQQAEGEVNELIKKGKL